MLTVTKSPMTTVVDTRLDLKLIAKYGPSPADQVIIVDVKQQRLHLYQAGQCLQTWDISTASRGVGNNNNSLQTPLGMHRIAEKIGAQCPANTIFAARQDTGQLATIFSQDCSSGEDLVTSRIMWLRGVEEGYNLNGDVDTFQRYIYIHGTPEEGLIGTTASHGCIRMRNHDIIALFERVDTDTLVYITDSDI